MSGYVWAKTADDELLVVLVAGEKCYVPGVENAIDLAEIHVLEPVKWPMAVIPPSRNSAPPSYGARAPVATQECVILPFAVNG